jgi:hypothetical protein
MFLDELATQEASSTERCHARGLASCATDTLSSSDLAALTLGFKAFPLNDVKGGFHEPSCVVGASNDLAEISEAPRLDRHQRDPLDHDPSSITLWYCIR